MKSLRTLNQGDTLAELGTKTLVGQVKVLSSDSESPLSATPHLNQLCDTPVQIRLSVRL